MPFQPINFAAMPVQGNEMLRNLVPNLMAAIKSGMQISQMPSQMRRQAEQEELSNKGQMLANQLAEYKSSPEQMQQVQQRQALENSLNQEKLASVQRENNPSQQLAYMNQIINESKNLPSFKDKPELAEQLARKMAGLPDQTPQEKQSWEKEKLGIQHNYNLSEMAAKAKQDTKQQLAAGGKNIEYFIDGVQSDNPGFNKKQARDAANALLEGKQQLPDGTPINSMSGTTDFALSSVLKGTTDSQQRNREFNRLKAEATIPILNKYIENATEKYGDTFKGYSAKQLLNFAGKSEKEQVEAGEYLAAQQLIFDRSQEFIRIAGANPSVSLTNHLMKDTADRANVNVGSISPVVRKSFNDYIYKALQESSHAMEKVNINASELQKRRSKQESEPEKPESKSNPPPPGAKVRKWSDF